jgi:magnesium transporter
MALLQPAGQEYLKSSVFTLARNRIVCFLVLMVSATFTGKIIENFEGMLALVVGLTACIPMLMDTCGNAGSQVSTLIIRGPGTGRDHDPDYFKVLYKELRVALLCGLALAVVNFGRMAILGSAGGVTGLSRRLCATMLCAVVVSKCIGCTLPIVAKRIHLDPALMAGPMLTTIVDAVTLAIFFPLQKPSFSEIRCRIRRLPPFPGRCRRR